MTFSRDLNYLYVLRRTCFRFKGAYTGPDCQTDRKESPVRQSAIVKRKCKDHNYAYTNNHSNGCITQLVMSPPEAM